MVSARIIMVFLHTFVLSLLGTFTLLSIGAEQDINCLKSIKKSLEDTNNILNSSWNFNNNTEGFICTFRGVECWHPDENKVINLRLSDMGLRGEFPRGIQNCTSLTGLYLSRNELSGPIPSDVSKLIMYVTKLDLSYNNFSGEIPAAIFNVSYLNVLMLNNNRLTGQISPFLGHLNRIKNFCVANNFLTGQIPNFFNVTFSAEAFANNPGLCGSPLDPCQAISYNFHASFKNGFVVGWAVAFVLAMVCTFFCMHKQPMKHKTTKRNRTRMKQFRAASGQALMEDSWT